MACRSPLLSPTHFPAMPWPVVTLACARASAGPGSSVTTVADGRSATWTVVTVQHLQVRWHPKHHPSEDFPVCAKASEAEWRSASIPQTLRWTELQLWFCPLCVPNSSIPATSSVGCGSVLSKCPVTRLLTGRSPQGPSTIPVLALPFCDALWNVAC